jgi:hypothetical protein
MVTAEFHGSARPSGRADDIARTAAALRAKYLRQHASDKAPLRWRILHFANVSNLSDAAFRTLFTLLTFSDRETEGGFSNIWPSNETVALLLGREETTVKRAIRELEGEDKKRKNRAAWLLEQQRRYNQPTIRRAVIPKAAMDALAADLAAALADTESANSPFLSTESANLHFLYPTERANLSERKGEFAPLPFSSDLLKREEERDIPAREVSFGFSEKGKQVARPSDLPADLPAEICEQFWQIIRHWGGKPGQVSRSTYSLEHAEDLLIKTALTHQQEPAHILRGAFLTAISTMQTMVASGDAKCAGSGAATNFFKSEFTKALRILKIEAERHAIELAGLREREAIKTETERQASAKKLSALDQRIAANDAAKGRADSAPECKPDNMPEAVWQKLQADKAKARASSGPARFRPDEIVMEVHRCIVKGADANELIDAVPGATYELVRRALKVATGERPGLFGADPEGFKKANLKDVTDWCDGWLKKQIAYEKHGTPEALCGGRIGTLKSKDMVDFETVTPYGALSQAFLDGVQAKYPLAWESDQDQNPHLETPDAHYGTLNLADVFRKASSTFVVKQKLRGFDATIEVDWSKYGPASQKTIEDTFEQAAAAAADRIVNIRARNEAYKVETDALDASSGITRGVDDVRFSDELITALLKGDTDPNSDKRHYILDMQSFVSRETRIKYGLAWRPYQARKVMEAKCGFPANRKFPRGC